MPADKLYSLPYQALRTGTLTGSIAYSLGSRIYHTARALARQDSSLFFCAERGVEVHWIFQKLGRVPSGLLLEVGDVLGPALTQTGFTVETVDLHPRELTGVPKWSPVARDCRQLEVTNRYDAAVSISTLEHIGMGSYGDELDPKGDSKTVASVLKALKPGARFLATVPMGDPAQRGWQRHYSRRQVEDLFGRFVVREIVVYNFRWVVWRRATADSATESRTLGPARPDVTTFALVDAAKPVDL